MKLPKFSYRTPHSVAEVIRLLADNGSSAKIISGGQSLIPVLAFRLSQPGMLVDLRHVPGLDHIRVEENVIRIGSRVRWADILTSEQLRIEAPLLVEAVAHVAHYQVRNKGTVGGSLAHGDFAAELPAVAIACQATVVVEGVKGRRGISTEEFFIAPLTTALDSDEVVVELTVPRWLPHRRWGFKEFARQKGAFALAGIVAVVDGTPAVEDARIVVFGGVSSLRRATEVENSLKGKTPNADLIGRCAALAATHADVYGDYEADVKYRKALVSTLMTRALNMALYGGERRS